MDATSDGRLAEFQRQVDSLDSERLTLERELTQNAGEMARWRVRVEALEDQHRFDQERFSLVDRDREALRTELRHREEEISHEHAALVARIDMLGTERDALTARLPEVDAGLRWGAEQRLLTRHLIRTQETLEARSEQLGKLLASRWLRVARAAWRARRRRPPAAAIILGVVTILGTVATAILASTLAASVAGFLAAAVLATMSIACVVLVPASRDHRVPAMAGQGTFADPLPDETVILDELLAAAAAAAEEPAEPTLLLATPVIREVAPAPRIVTRVVPGLPGLTGKSSEHWVAPTRTRDLKQLKVAGILDEMSFACFAPECRLDCGFTIQDWQDRLDNDPPHLLLVESAWAGNRGGWQYGVASYEHPDYRGLPALRSLLSWCRERGIPSVFWNKEDPIHFDRFKEAAAMFDHVFTTDANRIPAYEGLVGAQAKSVEALPFAAQPRLHNPMGATENRLSKPVFAGTYYRTRHQDRKASLEMILDAARPFGLVIYDRTLGTDSDEYGFPDRFASHIEGRLPYDQVIPVYKRHRVFLNVNSVADSPTMFSRRVFELLACGTAVLSTESVGIKAMFGDLVPIVESSEQAKIELERLLHDNGYHAELTGRARRLVLAEHTYRHRLARVAEVAGFELSSTAGEEIGALALVEKSSDLRAIEDVLLAQSRAPDEILVGLATTSGLGGGIDRLAERFGAHRVRTVAQEDGTERRDRWRELAALTTTSWVAPLMPGATYGEHYLRNLSGCTTFASADVIGVASAETQAHRYAQSAPPTASLSTRALVAQRGWIEDVSEQRRWFEDGVRFYAGEPGSAPSVSSAAVTSVGPPEVNKAPRLARGMRRR